MTHYTNLSLELADARLARGDQLILIEEMRLSTLLACGLPTMRTETFLAELLELQLKHHAYRHAVYIRLRRTNAEG